MFTSLAIPQARGLPHSSAVYAFLLIISSEARKLKRADERKPEP